MVPDPLFIEDLTVNTTLTLNGVMSCPGGMLEPECFGLTGAACPDLSLCDIQGLTLLITNPAGPTTLRFGENGNLMSETAYFGDNRVALDGYLIDEFRVYSDQVNIDAKTGYDTIVGLFGTYRVSVLSTNPNAYRIETLNGGRQSYLSNGGIDLLTLGATGIRIDTTAGSGADIFLGSSDRIDNVAITHTTQASVISWNKPSGGSPLWIGTEIDTGLICNGSIPHVLPGFTGGFDVIRIAEPVIVNEGVAFISEEPDARIRASGFDLCTGQLYAQDGVGIDIYSDTGFTFSGGGSIDFGTSDFEIQGTISNPVMSQPLMIDESNGLDLKNTPIFNSDASLPTGVSIVNNGHVVINDDVRITGTLLVDGNVQFDSNLNGNIIGGDPCCDSSDERVKRDIKSIHHTDSWKRILHLNPVEYKFKQEYAKAEKWIDSEEKHRGFIAQEVRQVIPQATKLVNKTIGDVHYSDFHLIKLQNIVPDLVGALQSAHAKIARLEAKLDKLLQQKKQ